MKWISFFLPSREDLQNRFLLLKSQEKYPAAIAVLLKILKLLQKKKSNENETELEKALIYQQLGELYTLTGSLSPAQDCIEKSLLLGREENNRFPLWHSMKLLGDLWLARGQPRLAIETLLNSLEKAKEKESEDTDLASIYRSLAAAYSQITEYGRAVDYAQKALISEKVGNAAGITHSLLRMGAIHCLLGKNNHAKEYVKAAHKLEKKAGRPTLTGIACFLEGNIFRARGKWEEALNCYQSARKIFRKYSLHRLFLRSELEMGGLYLEMEEPKNLKKTLQIIEKNILGFQGEDVNVAWGYLEAWSEFLNDSPDSALETVNAHLVVAKDMEFKELLWQLHYLQGSIHEEMGNKEEAGKSYVAALEVLKSIWSALPGDLKKDYLKDLHRARARQTAENFYKNS